MTHGMKDMKMAPHPEVPMIEPQVIPQLRRSGDPSA
jgi:hypothetical protein